MDKDRIKGKAQDIKGRAKRQVGEWTGDEELQAEGTAEQAGGKVQNIAGNVKDAARNVKDDIKRSARSSKPKRAA
jgi:uncharacterized protein YjbJ (UPF0337 family)